MLTSVLTMPEASEAVHETVTMPVLLYEPSAGLSMLTVGATVSTTKLTEASLWLPAMS